MSCSQGGFWVWAKRGMLALFCIGVLFLLFAAIMLKTGLRGQFLDNKIQAALSEKLGQYAQTEVRGARLSLDKNFHIAVEANDIAVRSLPDDIKLNKIGTVRFGFSMGGLVRHKFQVAQIELQDAEMRFTDTQGHNAFAALAMDDHERIDFDAVSDMLFAAVDHLLEGFDRQGPASLVLNNILVHFPMDNAEQTLSVAHLRLHNLKGAMQVEGQLAWNGQEINLRGSIERDSARPGKAFDIAVNNIPLHLGASDGLTPYLADGRVNNAYFRMRGTFSIRLQGERAYENRPQRVSAFFSLTDGATDISIDSNMATQLTLAATYDRGKKDIEVLPSELVLGGVKIPFKGAWGPARQSREETDIQGKYHFELTSDKAVSSPAESPEAPLQFGLNLTGRFIALDKKAIFDRIVLHTDYGNLLGQGSLRFGEGSPETIFVLRVPHMPVREAKQLWPVNISRSARLWVLSHVFGGELADSAIEIALPGGFFMADKVPPLLTDREVKISAHLKNFRFNTVGEIPPLRKGVGTISVNGTKTDINLSHAIAYIDDNERIDISDGAMTINWIPSKPLFADLSVRIGGTVGAVGKLLAYQPVNAVHKVPFDIKEASGDIQALLKMHFPMTPKPAPYEVAWDVSVDFQRFSIAKPFQGSTTVSNATGSARINKQLIELKGEGVLNGVPARMEINLPVGSNAVKKHEKIMFYLDDQARNKLFPALNSFLKGEVSVLAGPEINGRRHVVIDLSKAHLEIPWLGWKKDSGVAAKAELTVASDVNALENMEINDFDLSGATFQVTGKIIIKNRQFAGADFSRVSLNRNDKATLSVIKNDKIYQVKMTGQSFDMRSLIKHLGETNNAGGMQEQIELVAQLDHVDGFYSESLTGFKALYSHDMSEKDNVTIEGMTRSGRPVVVKIRKQNDSQTINASTTDAGAVLRFMNFYDKMHGGHLEAALKSVKGAPLSGPVRISGFQIINEPKLASIVSTSPAGGGKSLREATKGKIDVSRVMIDYAFGHIAKGDNYLVLDKGVIRGPTIGATFQGILYDAAGNITMTGTFMPGYGLNRLFSDVPILGAVLGNGRDRGLIGITFKVEGNAKRPRIIVNPISVIAPGIFRSIFEFK